MFIFYRRLFHRFSVSFSIFFLSCRWSHWLMSYANDFSKDLTKLIDHVYKSVDVMTLGSGALAGNPFAINREQLAKDLKFSSITLNSLSATSSRDHICKPWLFLFCSFKLLKLKICNSCFKVNFCDLVYRKLSHQNFYSGDAFLVHSTWIALKSLFRGPDHLQLKRILFCDTERCLQHRK